jgi:hypothetical protein
MDERDEQGAPFVEAPWVPWVPESKVYGLSPEQQALLGVGLMLMRAPALVRTASFAWSVYRWYNMAQYAALGALTSKSTSNNISVAQYRSDGREDADENARHLAGREDVTDESAARAEVAELDEGDLRSRPPNQSMPEDVVSQEQSGQARQEQVHPRIPTSSAPTDDGIAPSQTPTFERGVEEGSLPPMPNFPDRNVSIPQYSLEEENETGGNAAGAGGTELGEGDSRMRLHSQPVSQNAVPQERNGQPQETLLVNESENVALPPVYPQYPGEQDYTRRGGGTPSPQIPTLESSRVMGADAPSAAPDELGQEVIVHRDVGATLAIALETAYGGIFYLINLGLFLELYGDFTMPLGPGIALSIWDFIALLGQQMLGEDIVADPVWPLLAQLAGRDIEEPPGYYFEPPEYWRVPAEWLKAFPEENNWSWSVENGRLRVLHPAQFLVLDLSVDTGDPAEQLEREMDAYTDLFGQIFPPSQVFPALELLPCGRTAVNALAAALPLALQRWLYWLMPYVYIRLQRALGMAETEDPSRKLCRHGASISITATHMHVTLPLAELPIEIRIAGLDRDPGWVPAAGRFIAFHFQ